MKKLKKPGRGRKYGEGTVVRSLREQDDGATGVIISLTRRQKEWAYNVLLDSIGKVVTRREDELEEVC